MKWDVRWMDVARRDLRGLPTQIQHRVARKVEASREDPLRYYERLTAAGVWRLRVGDYRVLADLHARERRIDILAIGHRRNVYG